MDPQRPISWLLAPALLVAAVGCGAAPPPPVDDGSAAQATSPPPAKPPPAPAGSLSRQEVDAVLEQGPPWLLQRVEIEEVIDKGQFVGWRLVDLPPSFGSLQRGDVVKRVNGNTIERPDELWKTWTAIAKASEIRIAFERDGKDQELAIPISGETSPETVEKLDRQPPPPAAKANGGVSSTIVIQGE